MVVFVYYPFISDKYQEIMIEGLIKYNNRGIEIVNDFLKLTGISITVKRALQFIFMVILQLTFGFTKGGVFSLLTSGRAEKVRAYLSQLDESFPGGSTASPRMGQVLETCTEKLMILAECFQDYFYVSAGEWARDIFAKKYHSSRRAMTPPPECFLGLIAPSKLFPTLDVEERGILMPFFNSLIYQHARRISSINELIGFLKTPSLEYDVLIYILAAKLGFFGGPPGKNVIYEQFRTLEQMAESYNVLLNEKLTGLGMTDLSMVSVDGTNVPVDKRDTTGSVGTGSRGSFFGHKSSIACDANCIPLNSVLDTGHCSDASLYPDTISPVNDLASCSEQEIWCNVMDAAYSTISIISEVESMNVIPIVDINPKNSVLLKNLKEKGNNLLELVQKAFKAAPRALKLNLRKVLRSISKKRTYKIPLEEKKSILRALTRLLGEKILRAGLSPGELQVAGELRQELLRLRRKIRSAGTPYEKKIGLLALVYGTIEWLLIYSIRGQNEGINSILKKRGNLIGDGQRTSWLIGQEFLSNRQSMNEVGIKHVACVKFIITRQADHFLRFIWNWRHDKRFFYFIILVIFSRETPHRIEKDLLSS